MLGTEGGVLTFVTSLSCLKVTLCTRPPPAQALLVAFSPPLVTVGCVLPGTNPLPHVSPVVPGHGWEPLGGHVGPQVHHTNQTLPVLGPSGCFRRAMGPDKSRAGAGRSGEGPAGGEDPEGKGSTLYQSCHVGFLSLGFCVC